MTSVLPRIGFGCPLHQQIANRDVSLLRNNVYTAPRGIVIYFLQKKEMRKKKLYEKPSSYFSSLRGCSLNTTLQLSLSFFFFGWAAQFKYVVGTPRYKQINVFRFAGLNIHQGILRGNEGIPVAGIYIKK